MGKKYYILSIFFIVSMMLMGNIAAAEPETTESPMVTEIPLETEIPVATEMPVVTEIPAETEIPMVTETPIASEVPSEPPEYFAEMGNLYQLACSDYSMKFCWYSGGNHTGFLVYRKSNLSPEYEMIGNVDNEPFELINFVDNDFRRGISYTYLVVAYQEEDNGTYRELAYETESWKLKIAQPEVMSVERKKKTKAKVIWTPVSGVDGYEVYFKTAGGTFTLGKRIVGDETSKCTIPNISTEKKTIYKVRGYVKQNAQYAYSKFSQKETLKKLLSIIALKFQELQKKYPDGKYWNHVGKSRFDSTTITDFPCHHSLDGLADTCNFYDCPDGILGYQCYGFAWKMSDLIYGRSAKIRDFYSFSKCKAGDVIRYSGHSVIIVSKHQNYITVGECNYGDTCIIKWGRKIYPPELVGAKYSRRYTAGKNKKLQLAG